MLRNSRFQMTLAFVAAFSVGVLVGYTTRGRPAQESIPSARELSGTKDELRTAPDIQALIKAIGVLRLNRLKTTDYAVSIERAERERFGKAWKVSFHYEGAPPDSGADVWLND